MLYGMSRFSYAPSNFYFSTRTPCIQMAPHFQLLWLIVLFGRLTVRFNAAVYIYESSGFFGNTRPISQDELRAIPKLLAE